MFFLNSGTNKLEVNKMKSSNLKKIIFLLILLIPTVINAKSGCCSHHGGVIGCSENGKQICRDGTLSPSCTCTPVVTYTYGCTDPTAKNYNAHANRDNGSCEYYIYGCTDEKAKNYIEDAEKDDDSCEYYKLGCTNSEAINYDTNAEKDDNSCIFKQLDNKEAKKDKSSGLLSFLVLGGIGAGVYYFKKKRK